SEYEPSSDAQPPRKAATGSSVGIRYDSTTPQAASSEARNATRSVYETAFTPRPITIRPLQVKQTQKTLDNHDATLVATDLTAERDAAFQQDRILNFASVLRRRVLRIFVS